MSDELLAMMQEIGHVDIYTNPDFTIVCLYDPVYAATRVLTISEPTFEDAIRKAHAAYTAYVASIPEDMR